MKEYIFYKKINFLWILIFIKSILLLNFLPEISWITFLLSFYFLIKNNLDYKNIFIGISLGIIILVISYFNKNNKIVIGNFVDSIFKFSIRDWMLNYIKSNFNDKSSSIILITGFAEKNESGLSLYNLFIELSISHLIVVSGYHLSIISKLLNKLFIHKKLKLLFLIVILIIVNYNINFNFGIFRASIFLLLMINKKNNPIQMLSLSGIITLMLCPKALLNFSFLMSYLATYIIIFINKKISKKISWLISPILINILLFPIISKFANHISITGILFSFIYSNIFCFLFLFSTFFFWMIWLENIFEYIYILLNGILNIFLTFNFKINIIEMNYFLISIFYTVFYFLILQDSNSNI